MRIRVLEDFRTPAIPDDASVIIGRVHSITKSPVMDVFIQSRSGPVSRAVLKVYDRRFGVDLRKVRYEYSPCTSADESVFQSFVKSGKMKPFLDELVKLQENSIIPVAAAHFLDDDDDDSQDRIAHYEAALWQTTQEHFECETKAYQRLAEFQGKLIPRIYGHIRLELHPGGLGQTVPAAAAAATTAYPEEMTPYLEVKGILLERISGYSLWDLPLSPLAPPDPAAWSAIVQAAVDAVEAINRHGVMMKDSDPRNVIVDQHSQTPFIIDFAQCCFKEEVTAMWEKIGAEEKAMFRDQFDEDWEWNAEEQWWQQLHTIGNSSAIGSVTATRVRREKVIELQLRYPGFWKISDAIRQRARNRSGDA